MFELGVANSLSLEFPTNMGNIAGGTFFFYSVSNGVFCFQKVEHKSFIFDEYLNEEMRKENRYPRIFCIDKNGKIEYKKIPIPKQALNLIDWSKPLTFQISSKPREAWFKEILEGKIAYNLRHTFSSICQQYVRQEIVDIWIGDSPTRLIGKHYTHFPDKFMLEQMNLVKFPTGE